MKTQLTITKYHCSRFWALYEGDTLLAVVVYKKGALALLARLQRRTERKNTR